MIRRLGIVLARLEPGAYFGEQALLSGSGARSNATVRALTHCRLLVLTREGLLSVGARQRVRAATARHRKRARRAARRPPARRRAAQARRRRELPHRDLRTGEYVFRQGDPADRLYLVLQGRARVSSIEDPAGAENDLTELLPGQMFGEVAIMRDQPQRLRCAQSAS